MSSLPRDHLAFAGAGTAAVLLGLYALTPTSEPDPSPAPAQPPVAVPPVPPPAATPASTPQPISTADLILYGVTGGGAGGVAAVIGSANGGQRVVPAGRDYRPGLTVKEVGPSYAVLTSAGAETRLELSRFAHAAPPPAAPPPAQAATPAPAAALRGMDVTALRLGMAPQKVGGRTRGFSLKKGADLPALRQAGLQPGDVILAVNGQAFDSEEKLMELPAEIAVSYTAEFEFERNGKRMKAMLPINNRPRT